jgi:DNA replication initiation complex subunit (GINS family)
MLTFETIRKIFEEEKSSQTLVRLPDNFFSEAAEYMEQKGRMAGEEAEMWELDNVKSRLRAIFELRERKILGGVLMYVRTGDAIKHMLPEEKEFFDHAVELMKAFQARRDARFENEEEKTAVVSILGDIPKFVGINMKSYGPFRKGDVATIPEQNAALLAGRGLAKPMDMKE